MSATLEVVDPLSSWDAEASLLGSALLDHVAARYVAYSARPAWFAYPVNAALAGVMADMVKGGEPLDFLLVSTALAARLGQPREDVDDLLLKVAESVPSAANFEYYAKLVHGFWLRREIVRRASTLIAKASDPEVPVDDVSALASITGAGLGGGDRETFEIEDIVTGGGALVHGVPSGFDTVDRMVITRGYPAGQTTLVVAPQKRGKTSLMLQSALHQALYLGKKVAFATLEMDATLLKLRMLKQMTGFSLEEDLDPAQQRAYDLARRELDMSELVVFHPRESNVERIVQWAQDRADTHGLDILYVDYLQLLSSKGVDPRDSRVREIEAISRQLVLLGSQAGIPVVVGSQVTQAEDGTYRTKDSRRPEEDAGLVLHVHTRTVRALYNRFGPAFAMQYTPDTSRLTLVDEGEVPL